MLIVDGKTVESGEIVLASSDRGFNLGDGLFETMRCEGGRLLLLERHLARLSSAAEIISLPIDWALVRASLALACDGFPDAAASVRLTISRGTGPRGLLPPANARPVVVVTAAPAQPRSGGRIAAIVAKVRRNQHSPLSRMKSMSYQDQVLARMEAAAAGAEDAIMLNGEGAPASTSCANLFALVGGSWRTPPVKTGLLPGIMRGVLLEKGAVEERPLSLDEVLRAPLARTNSLVGAEPLTLEGGAAPAEAETRRLTEILAAAERVEP
jgi:branched-chain amino acid aminotransferase